VIVTHDQEEAMTVASRVAVMNEGRIIQVATPTQIYEAPNSAYVADFIGDVTLISGTAHARSAAKVEPETVADPKPIEHQRGPQPNALGLWLHDKVLAPIIGPRTDIVRQLPPPEPKETRAVPTQDVPAGGVEILWAEGEPPLISLDADPALDGHQVKLALRPEKIGISKIEPKAGNALKGKVIDIAYLGNLSTYHVELAGGSMIKVQSANTRRVSRRDITWEDDVWVSWSGTAGVLLDK